MKTKKQVLLWLVPVMLVAGVLLGCANDSGSTDLEETVLIPSPGAQSGLTVRPGQVSIAKEGKQKFSAYLKGAAVSKAAWSLSGASSGGGSTLSKDGELTVGADEKAGTLKITASYNGLKANAVVNVIGNDSVPVEHGVTVSPGIVTVAKGASQTFTALLSGTGSPAAPTWTLSGYDAEGSSGIDSSSGVLTVDADEAAEKIIVRASFGGDKYGTAIVYIAGNGGVLPAGGPYPENLGVEVRPPEATLDKGETGSFTADGDNLGTVEWSLEENKVETPIADGAFTVALNETAGKIVVKARSGDKSGTAVVTVRGNEAEPAVVSDGLVVDPQEAQVAKGGSKSFTAKDYDGNAVTVSWRVTGGSKSGTAASNGLLTVDPDETAKYLVVRAEAPDGKNGTAVVTVTESGSGGEPKTGNEPEDHGLKVKPQKALVKKGVTQTFSAVESGSGTEASGVTWSVTGGVSAIDAASGVLTVASGETAAELVVKAALTSDADKWGTAVVYVDGNGGSPPPGIPQNGGISVSPAEAEIARGANGTFSASGASNITWAFEGESASALSASTGPSTVLTVAGTEAAGKLTLKATSGELYGTAVINVSGETQPVAATLNSVSANGSSTSATTTLTLTFSQDITGLTKDHITLGGSTGAQKVTLSKVSGTGKYELTVSGITADGQVTVSVSSQPTGYNITGSASTNVYKGATAVTMTVTPNGNSTTTTTALTLGFSPGIANLALGEITISNTGNTGATKGTTLLGANTSYTLGLSGIKAGGSITVSVSKSGYSVAPQDVTVYYYVAEGEAPPATITIGGKSLKAEFGITTTGTTGVRDTFNAVSNFIKNNSLNNQTKIQLGDYIDLEGGLTVAAYGSGSYTGAISISSGTGQGQASWRITTTSNMRDNPNYESVYLRLIVVGINSFNGNSKNHIVFQFQNIPVLRRMNSSDTTSGGYAGSEMRAYLTNNFLPGLTSAGVPEGVLWAPKREMAAEYSESGTTRIEDKLWLPTEREMFGMSRYSNDSAETETNQGRLDYYYNGDTGKYSRRIKYFSDCLNSSGVAKYSDGWGYYYWEASPAYFISSYFCGVNSSGNARADYGASSGDGCAPAFCVAY